MRNERWESGGFKSLGKAFRLHLNIAVIQNSLGLFFRRRLNASAVTFLYKWLGFV